MIYHRDTEGTENDTEDRMERKGWECPKCGRCYAPDVKECGHCVGATMQPTWPWSAVDPWELYRRYRPYRPYYPPYRILWADITTTALPSGQHTEIHC